MTNAVEIVGLQEINRALKRAGPLYYKAARAGMIEGAEPVRRDAQSLAMTEFSGMKRAKRKPPPWSVQRLGSTVREVYIVPKERGRHGRDDRTAGARRRAQKFVVKMLNDVYDPALERNVVVIRNSVSTWLGKVTISL